MLTQIEQLFNGTRRRKEKPKGVDETPLKECVPTYFGVAQQKNLISTKSCQYHNNTKVAVRNFSKNGLSQITFNTFVMPKAVKMRWVVSNDHSKFLLNHIKVHIF